MSYKKKENYRLARIDNDLAKLIMEYNEEGKSFREASKKLAKDHQEMKYKFSVSKRLFSFTITSTLLWGLGHLIIMSVI